MRPSDLRLCEVSLSAQRVPYRTPIKFGGRVVREVLLLDVTVDAETRDGRRGRGFGSMPLGNVWAWPSEVAAPSDTQSAMLALVEELVRQANDLRDSGHPLELSHRLAATHAETSRRVAASAGLAEAIPPLAQLVAASPLDAAIHDAFGVILGRNSFDLLGPEWVNADLAAYLDERFAGEYLDRYTLRRPRPTMPLYHLVGALDPLTDADVASPVGDGLPETLAQWIAADGLTHLKIKLNGDDLEWDIQRVLSIERVAAEAQAARGCSAWHYSADFNEKCGSVEYVTEFLARIGRDSPAALGRLQYIEQPMPRDLRCRGGERVDAAAKIKPVVIDESLVDYESLLLARELGYSGVALKACKGQSEDLLMAAAAQKFGMFLCVQDLTCPGASFLHSASLAARIPGVAAIEGNARQYCPVANRGWAELYPSMFHVTDGTVGTAVLDGPGLGFPRKA
jgi:L-alanine-DL-glutamate epimerase-like enolase superfamily enzyme